MTSSGQDGTITKMTVESMVKYATTFFNSSLYLWPLWFLKDVSLTFIDKTDPSDPLKRENYWRGTLKTMAPCRLNIEESV